jgi:pectate lyase
MRYLKKYKIFETTESEVDDLISILQDLTLDIKDKDLKVDVIKSGRFFNSMTLLGIKIIISKEGYGRFKLSDIKDEIIQIVDFMDSYDWKIDYIEVVDAAGPNNVLIHDNMIINQYSGEEVNHLVGGIDIKFVIYKR